MVMCAIKGAELRRGPHSGVTVRARELPELPRASGSRRDRGRRERPRTSRDSPRRPLPRPSRARGVASFGQPMGVSGGRGTGRASEVNLVRWGAPRVQGWRRGVSDVAVILAASLPSAWTAGGLCPPYSRSPVAGHFGYFPRRAMEARLPSLLASSVAHGERWRGVAVNLGGKS